MFRVREDVWRRNLVVGSILIALLLVTSCAGKQEQLNDAQEEYCESILFSLTDLNYVVAAWQDSNRNGTWDNGELPAEGVTLDIAEVERECPGWFEYGGCVLDAPLSVVAEAGRDSADPWSAADRLIDTYPCENQAGLPVRTDASGLLVIQTEYDWPVSFRFAVHAPPGLQLDTEGEFSDDSFILWYGFVPSAK